MIKYWYQRTKTRTASLLKEAADVFSKPNKKEMALNAKLYVVKGC